MHNLCLKGLATGVFLILFSFAAMAQSISGKVLSGDDKQPLPGATIQVKGTSKKTVTDTNGNFTVAAENSDVLIISNIGFATLQLPASQAAVISLAIDTKGLGEVVVTALGIKKERKKLGYALQEMKGDELTTARETNVVNQLAGKVAGVTVVSSPSGVGGSSRVSIRGERSVDLNKNQPLYVIDGVPISNAINGGSGSNNLEVDFGNGASFINPDDIESMTVLKGAAAAALYGSRAANGVVMIKTKSGKKQQGLGVEVNSNLTLETPLKLPEYQKVYGQGNSSGGDFAFVNGAGSGLSDGTDEGWGPAYKGQLFPQFNSPRTLNGTAIPYTGGDMNAPAGSVITPTKWEADNDNLKNFLETGRTFTNNVAITGGNDKGDLRVSYTNLDQKGMVPNTGLKRNTTTFSGSYNLTPKFTVKSYASYIRSESDNRPSISYGTESIMYLFNCWLPSSVKVSDLRRLWQKGLDNKQQYNWNYNYHDNPYMTVFQNTNGQYYDRLIGNVILRYDLTSWLNVQLRSATDWSSERREYHRAFSTQRFPYGEYREVNIINEERNTDFLFAADKEINSRFSVNATLGGNQMRQTSRFNEAVAGQLNIPDIYRLTNSRIALVANQNNVGKRINSFYGSAGVSYDNKLFLDVTGRNDRSSALTLPEALKSLGTEKNSYFYSSVALSAVISDMIKLPAAISFAKVRASFAQVGNDTDPFAFTQTYNRSDPYGASQVYGETSRLSNLNLKPEISSAYEFGTDLRFLNNRAGIDITYYQSNTKNQILNIPLSNTSGYETRVINAGSIRNSGVEVMLNVTPVQKKHFTWSAYVNFSANRSKVIELSDGLDNYVMADRSVSVEARVGQRMGDLYGIGFARVQNTDPAAAYYDKSGKYTGQMVFAANGRPVATTERIRLGNYNPDWLMGIGNNFSYKGVRLSFLFDIRQGGKLYSHTQTVGREGGIIKETLEGRADGYDMSKPGNGVIGTGAVQNGDGSFSTNTTKVAVREWHSAWTGGRSIAEGVMYDASFVKLRELQIGYTIPGVFGKRLIKGLSVSLVGRNLLLWDHVPHVDPENMSYSGGTALPGIEYMSLPTARSYGVNLSFKL
ncbi:SusC/RagA family TonB-linked outer membrane protein [Chitinophaga oryziterrae]|uniref:SusC/RagA family TonB-linked outer membrane protein n=1 Tax=Chitinophaga oryziterrae TaxID=1031224 RepID=A0A6N8JIG9_9BACT|nr:SusC/RagA family TonB-linked outer membrane protein [Chitinophaga oryziterrae]MVT44156.1 SusC/RagA family TonB-linked outer membrane protein [Chitinophaga oryziterrae]